MAIVIGDIHGCYNTFLALLEKLPQEKKIFTGDLIDRGPDSKKMVQWVIDHKEECIVVRGNHEQMLLDYLNNPQENLYQWLRNGGGSTLDSYGIPDTKSISFPEEHIKFFENLPISYIEDDLYVSHSSYCKQFKLEDLEKTELLDHPNGLLWHRETPCKIHGKFHIFGHTPNQRVLLNDFSCDIDTGCIYKKHGYGTLSAIHYPSKTIYTQDNIEVEDRV